MKASFDHGPKVDGKGMKSIKEVTPQASVEGEAASNVPGGESKKGSWIKLEGPNSSSSK